MVFGDNLRFPLQPATTLTSGEQKVGSMNETQKNQGQAVGEAIGAQVGTKPGTTGGSRKVRGDGSATLSRLVERRDRHEKARANLQAAIAKQAELVASRQRKVSSATTTSAV